MIFYSDMPQTLGAVLSSVYLAGCAAEDLAARKIHVGGSVCAGAAALLLQVMHIAGSGSPGREALLTALALLPGAFLLLLAFTGRGAAGCGDGICYLVLGLFLGTATVWMILLVSLCMACAAGMVLLAVRRAQRRTRLPFLTFSAAAWAVILAARFMGTGS